MRVGDDYLLYGNNQGIVITNSGRVMYQYTTLKNFDDLVNRYSNNKFRNTLETPKSVMLKDIPNVVLTKARKLLFQPV
jgi:hypothetical protein